jgi:hypothetical protein
VRTKLSIASAPGRVMARMHGRRAWLRRPTMERLEGRDLPSAMTSVGSTHIELPNDNPGVAEVVSSMATRQGDRRTLPHPTGRGLDDQSHIARAGDGTAIAPLPLVPNNLEPAVDTRRPPSQNATSRALGGALVLEALRTDAPSDALADDPPAIGQEMIPVQSGGAAAGSAGASALVGWALGAAMPLSMSVFVLSGPFVGTDDRAGASAGETRPPWLVDYVVPELELRDPAPGDARTALAPSGNEPSQLAVPMAASDGGGPAWANLLQGALHADWEVVNGELRQFLSGLGGLVQHTDESGAGPTWPVWIGVATALLLARRASYVRRRLFRRPVPGALWVSPRPPVPVGPWPLGPP